jgi:ABC-type amino acid transport substrate-binding protein
MKVIIERIADAYAVFNEHGMGNEHERFNGRRLVVGVDQAPPAPMNFRLPGSPEFRGFEVDLTNAVANHLAIDVECDDSITGLASLHGLGERVGFAAFVAWLTYCAALNV